MNFYQSWGFSESPFQTTPLPASSLGETLLVGRREELNRLKQRICNPPKISTLEGPNGIGKTSLANVASYQLYQTYLDDTDRDSPLLIPCQKIFQLKPGISAEQFIAEILFAVAQTLLLEAQELLNQGFSSSRAGAINKWLNSPQITSFQGHIGALGIGKSTETNTAQGFLESGFRQEITLWLNELFPSPYDGGVICIIDNLELLQTSRAARDMLEQLRDELFVLPGLRWILCAALGVVLGIASSPRLEGFLHSPIQLGGIDEAVSSEILNSRINAYKFQEHLYLPLLEGDFRNLYFVLNRNLRSVLGQVDNFCQWVADRALPDTEDQKHDAYREWLRYECDNALSSVQNELRPRAWRVFVKAVELEGEFSPSDYEDFDFNSIQALRPQVKNLEDVGLLRSVQDDGDKRRKTIQVTSKGWLVNHALSINADKE